jgi:hypothetical protein
VTAQVEAAELIQAICTLAGCAKSARSVEAQVASCEAGKAAEAGSGLGGIDEGTVTPTEACALHP